MALSLSSKKMNFFQKMHHEKARKCIELVDRQSKKLEYEYSIVTRGCGGPFGEFLKVSWVCSNNEAS
jgi:hypothetical protein